MNRCPQGDFYVVATWHPTDPYRYCQYNIPADSYLETMALAERIYKDGLDGLGSPHSISIELIKPSIKAPKSTTSSTNKQLI